MCACAYLTSTLLRCSMDEDVAKTLSQPEVGYSRVWEDHRVLSKALAIQTDDTVLCITSAGDNVLNLLLDEPRKIVALDLSQAQNCLLELKLAAIRCLSHQDFLVLLGETNDTSQRWDEIYAVVKQNGQMPSYAQQYWENHHKSLKSGGGWFGKYEKFILAFSQDKLPGVVTGEQVDEFLSAPSLEEQRQIFDGWPIQRFKETLREYASQGSQTKGRSAAKFKFVQHSDSEIKDTTWARLERACRDVPVRDNFYLSWLLRGGRGYDPLIRPEYAPPYLSREAFDKLKGLVDRVVVHTGALEDYFTMSGCERPSKIVLSNIFEYMSQESADSVFDTLGSHMPAGGRVVYWEYMNSRSPSGTPGNNTGRARLHDVMKEEEFQELQKEDRALFFLLRVLQVK